MCHAYYYCNNYPSLWLPSLQIILLLIDFIPHWSTGMDTELDMDSVCWLPRSHATCPNRILGCGPCDFNSTIWSCFETVHHRCGINEVNCIYMTNVMWTSGTAWFFTDRIQIRAFFICQSFHWPTTIYFAILCSVYNWCELSEVNSVYITKVIRTWWTAKFLPDLTPVCAFLFRMSIRELTNYYLLCIFLLPQV